jgi:3',5'-cyclic AMP phosphodiesterase CpdA
MTGATASVAILGDTHFGHVDAAACRALIDDLRQQAPSLVIIAGDLTQRARRSEFLAARSFIDALPCPVLTIPGNHDLPLYDLPRRLLHPYGRYRRYISADLEPSFVTPTLAAIGVDATSRLRHKNGTLDGKRIRHAARRLREAASMFRLVAVHQPLAALHAEDRKHVARGASAALQSWLQAGADVFVGGHVHRGYCLQVGSAPSGIVVQAGTAVSTRRRHGLPNSYFRIELQSGGQGARSMRILRRDHDARRGCFETRQQDIAVAEAGGWRLQGRDSSNPLD